MVSDLDPPNTSSSSTDSNARPPSCSALNICLQHPVLSHTPRKSSGRLPLRRSPGRTLLHHPIDLFETEALGLGHQEPCVDESRCTETAPDEEDRGLQVAVVFADHVWSDDGDDL